MSNVEAKYGRLAVAENIQQYKITIETTTGDSHSSEPFFTQVNHLVSSNRISKQVMNPADFSTLKIWDKSDHWFKSYGSKVNF